MSEERRGQIAYLFLKHQLRDRGVSVSRHTRREIGNTAKDLGITFEEAKEFSEALVRELVDEAFADNETNKTDEKND